MSALLLLIGISLGLSTLFVFLCIVSIRNGQFDDFESPRWRILFSNSTDLNPIKMGSKTETSTRMDPNDPN
jgi:cbb3-type cytochrome oxidase maturation protein